MNLSITHRIGQRESQVNFGESHYPAPQDHDVRLGIASSVQTATESDEVGLDAFPQRAVLHRNEVIEKLNYRLGQRELSR